MKPTKPYPTFPLTPHSRGGWAKKYKGHQLYLPSADPTLALAQFHRLAQRIDRGDTPGPTKRLDDATVYEVVNRYVIEREKDVAAGRLSVGALADYRDAANRMCDCFGEEALVEDLTPDDFTRFHQQLGKMLGAHALGRMVQSCRTIWKHATDNDWIRRAPRFGTIFKKPVAEKKSGAGMSLDEARELIAWAWAFNRQLEAMLLLMLNGGYTAKDCAALPRSSVDLGAGLIRFPRPKMKRRRAVDRVMVLWPETAEALADVMAKRPGDDLVFRTAHGNPWVQGGTDSVRLLVQRMEKDVLGWKAKGPSWFRHLHRTIADELERPNAAARLMGHRLPGMAEVYVDRIEHDRIREITDHIRQRLWPCAPAHPAPPA